MNEEKKINIEDGNEVEETEKQENNQPLPETDQEDSNENDVQEDEEKQDEKTPLEKAEEEIALLKDQYLRSRAEFENYRKRTIKEKTELILNGSEKTITTILPILDDFERALNDQTEDANTIKDGMKLIYQKFIKTLEGMGVTKIETDNKPFDVDFHEAIAMVPGVDEDKKGKVIDCVQTGYMLHDKVIRHAKVAVGQ